jgi:hypothetical protein
MARKEYRYNPETLSYDVIIITNRERIKKVARAFAASVVLAVVCFNIYSHFFDTPKERSLQNKLSSMKFGYQLLMQDLENVDYLLSNIQKRDDDIYRVVLESEPIASSIRQAGFGGANRYQPLQGYIASDVMITASIHTDRILKQLYVQSLSYDELIDKALHKELMVSSRPAILPISKSFIRSRGAFGLRRHPKFGGIRMHTGMDFAAPIGTEIFATGDGTVITTGYNTGGYGNRVLIDHGFGYQTLYAHMHTIDVEEGSVVKRGDILGTVGNTGTSVGPHVHYEVIKNGERVNPIFYFYDDLSPEEYLRMIATQHYEDEFFDDIDEQQSE